MLSRNKILNVIFIIIITYSSSSLARLAGAEGTFRNIRNSIYNSVERAERLFEENHGTPMEQSYDLGGYTATNSSGGAEWNSYLQILRLARNYVIEIEFLDRGFRGPTNDNHHLGMMDVGLTWGDGNYVPVAKGLLGAQIILIPVYNEGDEKITAWECLTNADRQIQEFLGSTGTKNFTASLIREYTDITYFTLCTFVDKEKLFE